MAKRQRVSNPTHKQDILLRLDDVRGVINDLDPLVDEKLEYIAGLVAENARMRVNRSNKSVDVRRNLDFWPDSYYTHKHLQDNIIVKESSYPMGGWLVKAMRPHAHLVEYGHYLVTPDGRTIGFVRPYPYLNPAKRYVMNQLGRMEL